MTLTQENKVNITADNMVRRAVDLGQRLAQVSMPIPSLADLDFSDQIPKATKAIQALKGLMSESNVAYAAAGVLEDAVKIIQDPQGQFVGVYCFNALQGADKIAKQLIQPDSFFDQQNRANLYMFHLAISSVVASIRTGDIKRVSAYFQAAVNLALQIGGVEG